MCLKCLRICPRAPERREPAGLQQGLNRAPPAQQGQCHAMHGMQGPVCLQKSGSEEAPPLLLQAPHEMGVGCAA